MGRPDPPVGIVVGADVGGTFTDLIALDHSGTVHIAKVPSTPDNLGDAVTTSLAELCRDLGYAPSDVALLLHGTTAATNAVLQRRGARTALLTTRGFRDVLEIARQSRPRLFDLDARRPEPLIPRSLRYEIDERVDATGSVVQALERSALSPVAESLHVQGVEAVAVCFLHSYRNPDHERAVARAVAQRLPSVFISLSSAILPEYREYERTSTTAINAFVGPLISQYLSAMEACLRELGSTCQLQVMQSNGGLMSAQQASQLPASTVLSGVAAGALGGVRLTHRLGRKLVLTLDMGGTSTDMALGIDGQVPTNRGTRIDGLPIRLPSLEVHTIGAGGGSIAYLDPGGALKVGPRSAGAVPGPACYGRGGQEPTVSDANLVLGRLSQTGLLGGRLPLDGEAAGGAVRRIAGPLGLDTEETAAGIIRVVNAGMARQMRVLTIERGIDPRKCALVAFGGSGPAHAVELARELEIPEVIVPPAPGVTSALGLLLSDMRHDRIQTVLLEVRGDLSDEAAAARLNKVFDSLSRDVVGDLPEVRGDSARALVRALEMRYRRQGHELRVAVRPGTLDAKSLRELARDFDRTHRERYGHDFPDEPILIVNAHATSVVPSSTVPSGFARGQALPRAEQRRDVLFEGRWYETDVVDRAAIRPEVHLLGPLIIEQMDSTTVIPPGANGSADASGNLIITVRA